MSDFTQSASRFLRELRLKGKSKEVLPLMKKGDTLKEYHGQRIFLHSSNPLERPSIQLTRLTISSLLMRGLVYPEKEDDGISYPLTEDGEFAASLLTNLY